MPPLREVIARHGLIAQKRFGQNFLLDMNVTRRIVKSVGNLADSVVFEVGPGPGGLTRALLEAGAKVVTIECDVRCIKILEELESYFPGKLRALEGDALELMPQSIIPTENIKIVSNLPYNIGTALLIQWLYNLDRIVSLTLMFQKEVALRLFAKPRTKDYGRLSILTQWLCEGHRLFDLPPTVFIPAPKVTSSVVQLIPKPLDSVEKKLFSSISRVTQEAFGQRRKMIRSSLKSLFSEKDLINLGLDPCSRAEELTVSDFILLAKNLPHTS
ncbi:MAG: 16S rRNA (adenine(1518)-N(6)/adenine(1519)-N(6))-dimethyltransferase RsmA [Alphaproteobacteria bacterium]|nr:16S rRNA (adenine(1518)-N(6)/adenine(1519)-N(6))-dimethyltransferase RsmA [Alphaproteobacteria bacterium]